MKKVMNKISDKMMTNIRSFVFILIAITIAALVLSCQKAEEPKGGAKGQVQENVLPVPTPESPSAKPELTEIEKVESHEEGQTNEPPIEPRSEEMVPLVTEVMSDEEFQAYLKENGIPVITKEDFKEPELVWEKTFDVPVEEISDLTEKGNSIVLSSTRFYTDKSDEKAFLFLDSKGNINKNVKFKDEDEKVLHFLYPAGSGKYAGVYKIERDKKKTTFTYYDEEGNLLWSKDTGGEALPDETPVIVSYSGEVIAIAKGNPYWDIEEERVDVDLNINKLKFYDSKGKVLSEYAGFRNMSIGRLSHDGKFFTGILWWSKGIDRSGNKLVYIRTADGKVIWERPFQGYWNIDIGDAYDLAVSEKGTYVAAVSLGDIDRGIGSYIHVFDKQGKEILRTAGRIINILNEANFLSVLSDSGGALIDIRRFKILPVSFNVSTFLRHKRDTVWEDKEGYADKVGRTISRKYLAIDGTVVWQVPKEDLNAIHSSSDGGEYLKMIKRDPDDNYIKILRLKYLD